uniref:Sugar phosphate transporter domain-containing protein n=1 Tax=Chlamydomonas leiostraca TaxID=1034604 RepID=A0A7S0WQ47_9CHLO|mmetsp:Transcript_22830/g.58123  ORF Transcript_22830/g.58123 Transcript_22830/m.58123 type:complete len:340 (+) Transcript_22830:287-1306(+)|eukprot:CAMPEP_0202861796 /NCGR_PEP_ID=MMETSP1391-20130828/3073_1 /ASSEMBLY_ACC=CAM_ASM_000867 /TAXON_ID=1034604 /ORGANISM="Chlamydomonas leiostraca, Strain SAG 11-49" /LENGTH=339 /DNA_ID=CAMNT_0049541233 /DNA_START=283 /DNA_END=1302 /DNA_ORIENTATION=-
MEDPEKQHKPPPAVSWVRRIALLASCLAWTCASSAAILANKTILVKLHFPYPVTVSWLGLLTTSCLSYIAMQLFLPKESRRHVGPRYYATRILPCGFFMAAAFLTGNVSFLFLTLAFVQMLKAFTPVVTMLLLFLVGLEAPKASLVASVVVISLGVAVASYGELNLSITGLSSMLASVAAEAIRLVLMQTLLVDTSQSIHPLQGLFYISSACTLWLMGQALVWEWGPLVRAGALAQVAANPYHFATAAVAGFSVNALAIAVIKLSSSLTLKVLGTVKDAALVMVSVSLLHEQVTRLQLWGYSLSLCGFLSYNVVKALQHRSSSADNMLRSPSGQVVKLA